MATSIIHGVPSPPAPADCNRANILPAAIGAMIDIIQAANDPATTKSKQCNN